MKTVGMGANKPTDDKRSDSAVKKENAALKKAHEELTAAYEAATKQSADRAAEIDTLTARVTEL